MIFKLSSLDIQRKLESINIIHIIEILDNSMYLTSDGEILTSDGEAMW